MAADYFSVNGVRTCAFSALQWRHDEAAAAPPGVPQDLRTLLQLTGTVYFPPGATTRQKALHLLHAAAEVEHQFVVQYLYAYFCGGGPRADAPNLPDLLSVATEEMGHLLTVQNLLRTLGEPPHIDRLRDITSGKTPSPFHLEPYRLPFIARFLVAESRDFPDAGLPDGIEKHLPPGLTMQAIHRVGVIYAMLYWLFSTDDTPSGPWTIPSTTPGMADLGHLGDAEFAAPAQVNGQLSIADDWSAGGSVYVLPAPGFQTVQELREQARLAIHKVAAQGEGPVEDPTLLSHAQRLRAMYDDLIARPIDVSMYPVDPYTRPQSADAAAEPNLIDDPAAKTQAELLDYIYEVLLLTIGFATTAEKPDRRSDAASQALNLMHYLGPQSREIVTKTRKLNGTGKGAPPFTYPQDPIPSTEAEVRQRLLARIPAGETDATIHASRALAEAP